MPLISQFYGILIYLYKKLGGHHNKSHIHVKYNEYEKVFDVKPYLSHNAFKQLNDKVLFNTVK